MSRIIAARFETFPASEAAVHGLLRLGIGKDDMSVMYVNPPGQHATFPIGGDKHADENARGADEGAGAGALVGAGAGAAIAAAVAGIPVIGIPAALAAVGVGAYTGSLAGSLAGAGRKESENREPAPKYERTPGVLLAVHVIDQHRERDIVKV